MAEKEGGSDDRKRQNPPGSGSRSRETKEFITEHLKLVYSEVSSQPVPDDIMKLLGALDDIPAPGDAQSEKEAP